MNRLLHQLRLRLSPGKARGIDRRLKPTATRRAQFVSFLEASGYRRHSVDTYERSLRRRHAAKVMFLWATAFAVAWIVLESARAVSMF